MSRWFRHYAGMMRDEKLVRVSLKSKQPVERVVWVWGAILESAAEIDDNGRFDLDAAEVAYFLRADEADICAIFDALADAARVVDGVVVNWGDRQFSSDRSKERQAAYRERQREKNRNGDSDKAIGDVTVTSLSQPRDGEVTAQETETETETYIPPKPPKGGKRKSDFELPDWVPAEPWAAFVEMRKAIKHPLTPNSMKLAVAELDRLRQAGNDPAAVLNQSALKSYRGLFEVKGGPPPPKSFEPEPLSAKIERLTKAAELYDRIGRDDDAAEKRREIAKLKAGQGDRLKRAQSIGQIIGNNIPPAAN